MENKKSSFNKNDTDYTTTEIIVRGNIWIVTVAKGKFNYVSILKYTNNPYRTDGTRFKDFDDAIKHYKSLDMKLALLKLETGII